MNTEQIRARLVHGATEYDRKQSAKRGWNPYALGIYLQRIDDIMVDIERGADPRSAIVAGFTDRLLDVMLKACGFEKGTVAECRGEGSITYQPTKP